MLAAEAQNLEGFLFGFGWREEREGREHEYEYEYEEPSLGEDEEDGLWRATKCDSIGIAMTSLTIHRHRHPPTKTHPELLLLLQKFFKNF